MTDKLRPMLAAKVSTHQLEELEYPVYVQPKYDGIRCLITKDGPVSRTLKPIPNRFIRDTLSLPDLFGCDGELMVGSSDQFRLTTSGIMSQEGEPDFTYFVFDKWSIPKQIYTTRRYILDQIIDGLHDRVKLCPNYIAWNEEQVEHFHHQFLSEGHEGTILRKISSPYKYGRSTLNQQYLLKFKEYVYEEVLVTDVTPLFTNENPQKENALGYAERSTKQEGLVRKNMLGALICVNDDGQEFKVGTGFTEQDRHDLWKTPPIGHTVVVRYFPRGGYDKPRTPSFIQFVDPIEPIEPIDPTDQKETP